MKLGRVASARAISRRRRSPPDSAIPAPAVALDHFQHGADVLLDIEAAKDGGFLRQIADAEAGALVHRQRGDVVAVEFDAAFIGLDQAGHHIKHRGLAGAVGAEQAHGFAAADRQADALDHLAADKALLDTVDGQKALAVAGWNSVVTAARPGRRGARLL
jgi:hypothetical protein